MTTAICFFAHGTPKGQPRPRAFARKMGSKFVARCYDDGTAEGWKSQIAIAAKEHTPTTPIEGPVRVDLTFMFPRPKDHFRTGKNAGQLKDGAPKYHTSKPDRDNCEKAVLDALKALGFFRDDSQVCDGTPRKLYADEHPGCLVRVEALT